MAIAEPVSTGKGPPPGLPTLAEVAQWRATVQGEDIAFTFLADGEVEEQNLTYAELDRRARRWAARLEQMGLRGGRALLTFEPGLEYIEALYGCLYAGVTAVPVYPPDPFRMQRTLPRLELIAGNAEAGIVLGSQEIMAWASSALSERCHVGTLAPAEVEQEPGDEWVPARIDPAEPACLQYTSGSTGEPKGVMLSNANLLHNLATVNAWLDGDGAVAVAWLPPYHDMGLIGGIMQPVYSGRRMILMSPMSFIQRPVRWLEAITRYRGTTSVSPNFGYDLCVRKIPTHEREGLELSCWLVALNGAEPVRPETLERFVEAFGPYGFRAEAFYPCYGLAENTLIASGGRKLQRPRVRRFSAAAIEEGGAVRAGGDDEAAGRPLVGCGRSLPGQQIAIVDPATRRRLPDGRIGEIWLRGPSVAMGYWKLPEETERTFGASIEGVADANGFLRTGDLGFIDQDELFVTGRLKDMIILWGRNYYPQDIERSAEQAHAAMKPGGGIAFGVEVGGEERLVLVHEVLRPRRFAAEEIVQAVRRHLAEEFGIAPQAIVLIPNGSLPKTTSGKPRRGDCRELYLAGGLSPLAVWTAEGGAEPRQPLPAAGPQDEVEALVARRFAEVLGAGDVGRDDDFFHFGGQSLRAAQLVGQLSVDLGAELSLALLFENPTPARLAAALKQSGVVARRRETGRQLAAHCGGPAPERLALSSAQRRLWFIEQMGAVQAPAHIPVYARLQGHLDAGRLKKAVEAVVARHTVLRTTFGQEDGQPYQQIHAEPRFDWEEADLSELRPLDRDAALERLRLGCCNRPFSLGDGPLLRVAAVKLSEDQHVVMIVLHHIVCDGWSAQLLLDEIAAVYSGGAEQEGALPAPEGQYHDFVAWESEWLAGERLNSGVEYWKARLDGAPPLELPLDFAAPWGRDFEGRTYSLDIERRLVAGIAALARDHQATAFMVCLAAWQSVLARYTGQDDLCVGTAVANRWRPEWYGVAGCFINTLVLRNRVDGGEPFTELLRQVRATTIEALAHSFVPFEQVVEVVGPQRVAGRLPLAQVLFLFQDERRVPSALGAVRVKSCEVDYVGLAGFDLALVIEPADDGGLRATWSYNGGLLATETVARIADTFLTVLEEITESPGRLVGELPIPGPAERQALLAEWNATQRPLPELAAAHQLIERRARRRREAAAVSLGDRTLTYGQLDEQSNRWARVLRRLGVGRNRLVGLHLDRSPEMLIALLAVWKAGGGYVPIDPAYPAARIEFMAGDAALDLLITESSLRDELPALEVPVVCLEQLAEDGGDESAEALESEVEPLDVAYQIYTSGSTGQPKGVRVPHRAVVNFLVSLAERPGLRPDDALLAITTISFDIAVLELVLPLVSGARIVLAPRDTAVDGLQLAALAQRQQVSVMQATPATWRMLLASGWSPPAGMKLLCGGEALDAELARQLLASGSELWNMYGPTETTIWSTVHQVRGVDGPVPIGRPIANTTVYVLDASGRPVPAGVCGELYIGGLGVALGYWQRDELTAERFVRDPFSADPAARLFRTGDRARWRYDGVLEFLGRMDRQLKIRGFRVEPGEIEAALGEHPGVAETAVVARDDPSGQPRLVAYVVRRTLDESDAAQWRSFLAQRLPEYMVPSLFVAVDALPRTPAGKIDRGALPGCDAGASAREYVAPRTPLEAEIAAAWCEVLGVPRVGVGDSFFELGGHSLLATQLVARLQDNCGVALPLKQIFEHPTVEGLAEAITSQRLAQVGADEAERWLAELEQMTEEEALRVLETDTASKTLGEPVVVMNRTHDVDYAILGAGPAGLQLGYHLQQAGRDYVILEGGNSPGTFFKRMPRHRKLISVNKVYTGHQDPEINLRWDWNSLLGDDPRLKFSNYSRDYFPDADTMVRYLGDYARLNDLRVECNTRIGRITRRDGFCLEDQQGRSFACRRLIVATGVTKPYVPPIAGIELAEQYVNVSIDPEEFRDQRVLIIGKGNSAFETADNLIGTAAVIHLASPGFVTFAWKSHFVGKRRAVNNNFLDTYLLKCQNATLEATIENIDRRGKQLEVTISYLRAPGSKATYHYDRVICCTGFRFDNSIFDVSCRPELTIKDRFPAQSSAWESVNVPDLYFAGTLMQVRDYRKTTSGFIHGFRYNVQALARILAMRYHGQPWPCDTLPARPADMTERIIERVNRSSALWQQFGFLGDLAVVSDDRRTVRYYEGVPVEYAHVSDMVRGRRYYLLTLEYGWSDEFDPFVDQRVAHTDVEHASQSSFLHPIIRGYRGGRMEAEHHIVENLEANWRDETLHVAPLRRFFEEESLGAADARSMPVGP